MWLKCASLSVDCYSCMWRVQHVVSPGGNSVGGFWCLAARDRSAVGMMLWDKAVVCCHTVLECSGPEKKLTGKSTKKYKRQKNTEKWGSEQ